jgi:bifunctional non-homologous end joining protein LigD
MSCFCEGLSALNHWTYEVKLDGYRAIGVKTSGNAILYSRNHKNFNKRFPQIAEVLRDLPADTVIDGEVVVLDESGRPIFIVFSTSPSKPPHSAIDKSLKVRHRHSRRFR